MAIITWEDFAPEYDSASDSDYDQNDANNESDISLDSDFGHDESSSGSGVSIDNGTNALTLDDFGPDYDSGDDRDYDEDANYESDVSLDSDWEADGWWMSPDNVTTISRLEFKRVLLRQQRNGTLEEYLLEPRVGADDAEHFWPMDYMNQIKSLGQVAKFEINGIPLHFVCMDRNGDRAHEKIKLIMAFAEKAAVDVQRMLSEAVVRRKRDDPDALHDMKMFPLEILMHNPGASLASVGFLCQLWPSVVHVVTSESILCSAVNELYYKPPKPMPFIQVLIDTAKQTTLGTHGLFFPSLPTESDVGNAIPVNRRFGSSPFYTLSNQVAPNCVDYTLSALRLLLQECPDALMHAQSAIFPGFIEYPPPLHNAANFYGIQQNLPPANSYTFFLRLLLTYVECSSIEAVAFALLLLVGGWKRSGFVAVREALEYRESDQSAEQRHLVHELFNLFMRDDEGTGNNLLHYVATHSTVLTDAERQVAKFCIVGSGDEDDDFFNAEFSKEEQAEFDKTISAGQQHKKHSRLQIFAWLSGFNPICLRVRNANGYTPLDALLAAGKNWTGDSLEEYVALAPNWPSNQNPNTGLYPFMLAASAPPDPDISTIFELLRYAPEAIAPQRG